MVKLLVLVIAITIVGCSEKNEQISNELQAKSSEIIYQLGSQMASDSPTNFKTGKNKIWFFSEGTKVVGNLYIPEIFKKADKLPAIMVVGPKGSVKEQTAGIGFSYLGEETSIRKVPLVVKSSLISKVILLL